MTGEAKGDEGDGARGSGTSEEGTGPPGSPRLVAVHERRREELEPAASTASSKDLSSVRRWMIRTASLKLQCGRLRDSIWFIEAREVVLMGSMGVKITSTTVE